MSLKRPTVRKRLISASEMENRSPTWQSIAQLRYRLQQWYEDDQGRGEWRDSIDVNATSMAQFPRPLDADLSGTDSLFVPETP